MLGFLVYPEPWLTLVEKVPELSRLGLEREDLLAAAFDHTPGWPVLLLAGVLDGQAFFSFAILTSVLLSILWPLVVVFSAIALLAGPALGELYEALEDPEHAFEQERSYLTEWDAYAARLRDSRNPWERRCLLLGIAPLGYPILLDVSLLWEHWRILGSTGSAKTHLGLLNLLTQMLHRRDGAVVVIDCKWDPALFGTVKAIAEQEGRRFRWLTHAAVLSSSYVCNPFTQLAGCSPEELVGFLLQSLDLFQGVGYGRSFFFQSDKHCLECAVAEAAGTAQSPGRLPGTRHPGPLRSFRDLKEILDRLVRDREFRDAQHLPFLIDSLCPYEQLNLADDTHPGHEALRNEVKWDEVLEHGEVVYACHPGATDEATAGIFARLELYCLLEACKRYQVRHGKTAKAIVFIDEAQVAFATSLSNIIAQARAFGLAICIAHQDTDQASLPGGADLRALLNNNAVGTQFCSVRDPRQRRELAENSGAVRYADLNYSVGVAEALAGRVGPEYAVADMDGAVRIGVRERIGTRLELEDVSDINRDIHMSATRVERNEGLTQLVAGTFPLYLPWLMPAAEFRRRQGLTWPAANSETLALASGWPAPTAETVAPQAPPKRNLQQQLLELEKKLGAPPPLGGARPNNA